MAGSVQLFIDGDWVDAEDGATFDAIAPVDRRVIGTVAEGHARRRAAGRSRPPTGRGRRGRRCSAFDRAAAMERVAEVIDERRDDLARTLTLDQGKPLAAEARDEVDELIVYFEMAAADARRMEGLMPPSVDANKRVLLYRVPRGVVSIISPWNWPYTMPAEILAPAIAYGNTVVWAPAPTTSLCAAKLAECLEAAEIPAGVVNMVTGPGPGGGRRDRRGSPAPRPSGSSGRSRPGSRSPVAPPARSCCSRWAATDRWSSWTTPTWMRPWPRR